MQREIFDVDARFRPLIPLPGASGSSRTLSVDLEFAPGIEPQRISNGRVATIPPYSKVWNLVPA